MTTESTATFEVSNLAVPTEQPAGEPLTVSVTVENTGETAATKTVGLGYDYDNDGTISADEVEVQREVRLNASASKTVELTDSRAISESVRGDFTVGVVTPDDSVTTTLTFVAPANFEVSNVQSPELLAAGDPLNVSATVENTGSVEGTKTVALWLDDIAYASREVTLASGESTTVELSSTDTERLCCITQYPAERLWGLDVVSLEQDGTLEDRGNGRGVEGDTRGTDAPHRGGRAVIAL